jgi:hypothetical protein
MTPRILPSATHQAASIRRSRRRSHVIASGTRKRIVFDEEPNAHERGNNPERRTVNVIAPSHVDHQRGEQERVGQKLGIVHPDVSWSDRGNECGC